MSFDRFDIPLEIKLAEGAEAGTFEGYGAVFGNVDSHGDMIAPGAFTASLSQRAAKGLGHVPMHLNHGFPQLGGQRGIGVWTAIAEDAKGLRVKGRISGQNTDAGRHLFERVKDGAFPGMSIGYQLPANGAVFGKSAGEPRRTLRQVILHEVSLVDSPSNEMARVHSTKSLASRGELEELLRSGGLAKGAAKRIAAAGWPALSGEPDDAEPIFDGKLTAREHKLIEQVTAQWMGVIERMQTDTKASADVSDIKTLLTGNLSDLKGILR